MALIGIQEGADRLGISHMTLRNWIKAGVIKGYRIGPHMIRVDESELAGLVTEVVA